ncbi:hypothetical protein EYZ11_002541 [Aspergillus tanneri]|uniref:Endoglucanase n=1 Tax=Aspergillus tanneri TaxID=1220188 RepID=A0A4S3JU19_9EURO|nr:uncharacterized protein ATNIH1004_010862 [Aspergillus tanneri]KAA8641923.1 hypothetical protein ATNIH1004_010862 [Aspergillus tanneri]THC97971.1 hypothetical protein EYZ11_002541 [Aspergillus tanneri]
MHLTTYLLAALATASTAMAHMEMIRPYALRSQYDPKVSEGDKDYDNTSPLNSDGSNFPCRGHHKDTPWRTVAKYQAGQQDYMELAPGTNHKGGSCQISLSYDNGQTFRVIQSYMGGCPLELKWDFTIPADAPAGKALFAWSWFNLEGNREMYMNCAHVEIEGGSASSRRGSSWGKTQSFNQLPEIFEANIGNGCSTVEFKETVFKEPGENVAYGGNVHQGDAPFPKCGSNV